MTVQNYTTYIRAHSIPLLYELRCKGMLTRVAKQILIGQDFYDYAGEVDSRTGQPTGFGVAKHKDGKQFKGMFYDGKINGVCIYTNSHGSCY